MRHLYDQDLVLWSLAQALRAEGRRGASARIDWENVAGEIESWGNSDRRTVGGHIAVIVAHLI